MIDVNRIKRLLDRGERVFLRKESDGYNPVSYSMLVKYQGDDLWRTPFEASSPGDCYNFDVGHYTFSKNLATNERVSFHSSKYPAETSEPQYPESEADERDAGESPFLERDVAVSFNQLLEAIETSTQKKSRWGRVSI